MQEGVNHKQIETKKTCFLEDFASDMQQDLVLEQQLQLQHLTILGLNQRLTILEEQHNPLFAEYNNRQSVIKQQQLIESDVALKAFYQHLQLKLNDLFTACKVISSGMVERKPDSINQGLTHGAKVVNSIGQLAGTTITLAGTVIDLALPGVGLMMRVGAHVINAGAKGVALGLDVGNKAHTKRENVKIARIAALVVSPNAMSTLVEEVARSITLSYQDQIKCLTTASEVKGLYEAMARLDLVANKQNGGAENLAECAVGRILESLRSGEIDPDKPMPLVNQLIESVFYANNNQGIALIKHQTIQTKDPLHANWTDHGIFYYSGIKTELSYFYAGNNKQAIASKAEKYGYRKGTEAEALRLGLVRQLQPTAIKGKTFMQNHNLLFSQQQTSTKPNLANTERVYRNTVGGKFILAQNYWVVSLCREKHGENTRHAFLILEGINAKGEYVLKKAELLPLKNDKTSKDFFLVGKAKVDYTDIDLDSLKKCAHEYQHWTQKITPAQAGFLMEAITNDMDKDFNYNKLGNSNLHSAMNSSEDAENSLSWAETKLKNINLDLRSLTSWLDVIIQDSHRHLSAKREQDLDENARSKNCLLS